MRLTGPFVTMVYSMIMGDMLTFGIIYVVVLLGFSQSFYFLYKGYPGVKSTLYHSYHSTWMALFSITLGDYSVNDIRYSLYTIARTFILECASIMHVGIQFKHRTFAHFPPDASMWYLSTNRHISRQLRCIQKTMNLTSNY